MCSLPDFLLHKIVSFVSMSDRVSLYESGIWEKEICFSDFGDYPVSEFISLQKELSTAFQEFCKPRDEESYSEMAKRGVHGYDLMRRCFDKKENSNTSTGSNSNEPEWLEEEECFDLLDIISQTVFINGHLPVAKLFAERYASKLSYRAVVAALNQLVENNHAKIYEIFMSSVYSKWVEDCDDDLWEQISNCEDINEEIVKVLCDRCYGYDSNATCFQVLSRIYEEEKYDLLKYILDNADYKYAKEEGYSALLVAIAEDGFFQWFSENIKDEYRQILPDVLEYAKAEFQEEDEVYFTYHALVKKYFGC